MIKPLLRAVFVPMFVVAVAPTAALSAPADLPAYTLDVTLTPSRHRLAVEASVRLPAALAGKPIEFLLSGALQIDHSEPHAARVAAIGSDGFAGINASSAVLPQAGRPVRYRVTLPKDTTRLELRYRGAIDWPLTTPPEESARSFSETAGTIGKQGVYLAGSTLWYPYFGEELFTFELTARAEEGWHLIAPGDGSARNERGVAHWRSALPVDELPLVGGPLTRYTSAPGAVEAQVYLRTPDAALAAKYLEATVRDLELYDTLIGPYPYSKFALVENFWETGYGMPSLALLGSRVIRFPFILTSSYPHELLHSWWGNSVFVDYASGNWCEGLTAYLADHLFKEQQGQGAEYRRDTLKRYRDYVRAGRDFPLSSFRSRHSAATEAVGYGKTLMGFHMLRRQLGDEVFKRALAGFYRNKRGERASFADLRAAFENASGQNLGEFFEQWVQSTGAPDLRVEEIAVRRDAGRFVISGRLQQVQSGRPWSMDVPIVVRATGNDTVHRIAVAGSSTPFEIRVAEAPRALEVDPECDVFRLLDTRETAPSIGQIFGEPAILAILPARASEHERNVYQAMLKSWASAAQKIEVKLDREIGELPHDRAVWIVGRGNDLATALFQSDPSLGLRIDTHGVETPSGPIPLAAHTLVLVRRHPRNLAKAIGWISVDPLVAAPGLARKLPHYGKYSYLGLAGAEPTNILKGEWTTSDSPLRVELRPVGQRQSPLPSAKPEARTPLAPAHRER